MVDHTSEMTIDELARHAGMTVRNVRAHQSRGLLPAPEIRGRTGYYGGEHATRLELITELQREGFTLESIKRIIDRTAGGAPSALLDFTRAFAAPFTEEQPEQVATHELVERWGDQLTPAVVSEIERLGFARPLGEDRWEVTSPALAQAAVEIGRLGIPLATALELMSSVRHHADGMARSYVLLFLERFWRPFQDAGEPAEGWPEIQDALERLRPLVTRSVVAIFQLAMTDAVEQATRRELHPA